MTIAATFERLHLKARANWWLWLFSVFCRVALAAGFIPSGIVKIIGERFASGVSANHPMGHYLEALHTTGYYYTFIGVVQVTAAVLLLVPRTVTLGAFLYFPIILNICVLSFAVRFDGSLFTAPLMVLANLFLLGWNYEKWKYILPFNRIDAESTAPPPKMPIWPNADHLRSFPKLFAAGVFACMVFFVIVFPRLYSIMPRNSLAKCEAQFKNNKTEASVDFCACVHTNGEPLDKCLTIYEQTLENADRTP